MHAPRSLLEAGMTTNIALVESADLRHDHITRTEALDHFTQFELPPGRDWLTSAEVAVAFGVSQDTLKHLTADHRAELESNGLRQSTAEDFRDLQSLKLQGRPPLVFSRRATLNVAMLLRDSEVARAVRAYLLNVEEYASAETRQVAAEMQKGSLAWYDALRERGADEFYANGNPRAFKSTAKAEVPTITTEVIEPLVQGDDPGASFSTTTEGTTAFRVLHDSQGQNWALSWEVQLRLDYVKQAVVLLEEPERQILRRFTGQPHQLPTPVLNKLMAAYLSLPAVKPSKGYRVKTGSDYTGTKGQDGDGIYPNQNR